MQLAASIVLYKNSLIECHKILDILEKSVVEKIYLVDHSGGERLNVLSDYSSKIEYVLHDNSGYGSGHNVAIRKAMEAGAKYHIVLNADLEFSPDVIQTIADFMNQNPQVGQLMPQIFYPDGRNQYLCKLLPTPFDLIARKFIPANWFKKSKERFVCSFTSYNRIMNVPYLSGCFMFLRISAIQEVGLFDEHFFVYGEDIDFSRRMHQKYKTIFYPQVSIIHNHAEASSKSLKMLWVHIVNVSYYFNKWGWFFDKERKKINSHFISTWKEQ